MTRFGRIAVGQTYRQYLAEGGPSAPGFLIRGNGHRECYRRTSRPIADICERRQYSDMTTEYVLDGGRVTSLQTFFGEMDRALGMPPGYTPNLDWLDDILSGGVAGIPDDRITLRWTRSEQSRQHLGLELFEKLRMLLEENRNVSLLLQ